MTEKEIVEFQRLHQTEALTCAYVRTRYASDKGGGTRRAEHLAYDALVAHLKMAKP